MPLIKNGSVVANDPWTALADDAPVSDGVDVIVSLPRLLKDADALKGRNGRLGVRIEAGEDVMTLAPHIGSLAVVALNFPKFGDGRAFSSARLLRDRLAFGGEIRAVGDVLRDQLFYMLRSGFDAFEIPRPDAADVFGQAIREMSIVYQGAADDRAPAWRRRHAKAAGEETPRERAERLNAALRNAPADVVLRTAMAEFPGRVGVVSSFGAEAAVLLNLVAEIDRATPVLFLETGKHFAETAVHRENLVKRLGLKDVRLLHPEPTELRAEDPAGDLNARDTDACCALRKTRPLNVALEGFDAWITGRKRFQTESRLTLPVVEVDDAGRLKFNPLANWSQRQLDDYMAERSLPKHPLVAQGYLSIGCEPCTSRTQPGEDARAGRWRGIDKEECGIHFTADGKMVRTRTVPADAS